LERYRAQKYNFIYQRNCTSKDALENWRKGALKKSGRSLASKFELPKKMRVWPGRCWFFPIKILRPNVPWKHGRPKKHLALSASEKNHQAGLKKAKLSLYSKTGGLVTTGGPARQTKNFKQTEQE
jgi:hypothetical protein